MNKYVKGVVRYTFAKLHLMMKKYMEIFLKSVFFSVYMS